MLQVLVPGLGYGDCLNNTSSFWAFLCPSWCKPYVLTKPDWILKEGYYTALENLIFHGSTGVKALFFFFFFHCMYHIWPVIPLNGMKSSRLGVSLLPSLPFSLLKYAWQRLNTPLPQLQSILPSRSAD